MSTDLASPDPEVKAEEGIRKKPISERLILQDSVHSPTLHYPVKPEAKSVAPNAAKEIEGDEEEDEDEESGILKRYGLWLLLGALVVGAGLYLWGGKSDRPSAPVRKVTAPMVLKVQLPPPPPPPPPKIQPPPPKEQKVVEQAPVAKPEPAKPAPEKPPEGLGTNNKGPGPGLAGLGTSGNGVIGGNGLGGKGGGNAGSWYASKVQSKVAEALRNHRKTRSAKLRVEVRVWPDRTGRLSRVELAGSTGDSTMDAILRDEVLSGIQITEAPPQGMSGSILLRITANRPN